MALFKRRPPKGTRSVVTNTAENILPAPPPNNQTVHHHTTNWPGVVFAVVVSGLISLPILWLFWVALFEQLGSTRPEREAALWAISILLLPVAAWLVKWLVLAILESLLNHRLEIEKEKTERLRIELLAVQSAIDPGRMTEADYQFAQVILAVMNETYNYIEKHKSSFKGRERPWSIDSVVRMAKGMNIGITQVRAKDVKKWLVDNSVVIGELDGQVNVGQYPDLGKVRALLDKRFGRPITVSRFPPLRDNWGYEHMKY